jgi:hypothetical protein
MRKYVLPVVVCSAIGALVVVFVQLSSEKTPERDNVLVEADTGGTDEPGKSLDIAPPAETRTKVEEHRYLRELERAMARADMKHARWYQQKVCEDIDRIDNDPKLAGNLLALIKEQGIDSDDLKRRDVMLQILRVMKHPEATAMIQAEYYRARTPEERMLLLEAMSHSYHDPKTAAIWAVDIALNDENKEYRERAFEMLDEFSKDDEAVVDTATKIYQASSSPRQRFQALRAIGDRVVDSKSAREFIRARLMNPREEEISIVIEGIPEWGTEEDAAYLEQLVNEFPSQKEILEQQARALRKRLRGEAPDPAPEPEEEEGQLPPPPRDNEPPPPPPDDDK